MRKPHDRCRCKSQIGMASSRAAAAIVVLALAFAVHSSPAAAKGLSPDFYDMSCPQLKQIVASQVAKASHRDSGVAPGLMRILFHDCFPQVRTSDVYMYVCVRSSLATRTSNDQGGPGKRNTRPPTRLVGREWVK